MGKNILIFSDGTGQAGGVFFDENRSNIYKLYRATRVGPDSGIDPAEQIAFYDAGLGSRPPGGGVFSNAYRSIYNLVSQATGFGLTTNMIDCYEMLVRLWKPGDRIFLFGSAVALTPFAAWAASSMCGIPTTLENNAPLKRDSATARRLATIAVKRVYQHTSSKNYERASDREKELLDQRGELARRFRATYGVDENERSRFPYFIGVFDTVAALANPQALVTITAGTVVALVILSWLLSFWALTFAHWLALFTGVGGIVAAVSYAWTHVKGEVGLPRKRWWRIFHWTEPKQKFYDRDLNDKIAYARHAISIDENRKDFPRVRWGDPKASRSDHDEHGNVTFQQIWFAGNHSDIGGRYPDAESRLSDITLDWMARFAERIPNGIKVNPALLCLYPSADGMQHDEVKRGFTFVTKWFGWTWAEERRRLPKPGTTAIVLVRSAAVSRTTKSRMCRSTTWRRFRTMSPPSNTGSSGCGNASPVAAAHPRDARHPSVVKSRRRQTARRVSALAELDRRDAAGQWLFIPPPSDQLGHCLDAFERFLHSEEFPPLVRAVGAST